MAKLSYSLSLVAIALCVSAWEPPKLPSGRRLQYYILHPEGDYVFGYDTGEGSSHAAKSVRGNRVSGQYQYGGNTGSEGLKFSYTGGFAVPETEVKSTESVGSSFGTKSSFASSSDTSYESGPSDASYSFSYDAGDHSRSESSDADGNIRGSFAFTAKDGVGRKIDYEAGSEKGFIAKGAHIPVAPEVGSLPKATVFGSTTSTGSLAASKFGGYQSKTPESDGSYSFSYNAGDHSRSESADNAGNVRGRFAFVAKDGVERKVDYEAGAEKGFVARGSHIPAAETTHSVTAPLAPVAAFKAPQLSSSYGSSSSPVVDSNANVDGSYSFSYNAGDHSRQESADPAGNVRGQFSFVAKDGVNRKVDYEAGAGTGFIAKGSHLPVSSDAAAILSAITQPATSYYSQKSVVAASSSDNFDNSPGDASYSFSYDAGDHARQESADSAGNVRGQYSFVAKDGVNRKVDYEAGANTGFLAKGAHIPADTTVAHKASISSGSTFSSAPNTFVANKAADISSTSSGDGSYSFSYQAEDHSRQESADPAGNVRGYYAFVAKDGVNRQVNYEAGAETGFVAKGSHLPVSPDATATSSGSVPAPASYYSPKPYTPIASSDNFDNGPVDASYSFSYDAGDHSRQESSDSAGNVRGNFAFVAKDGVNRKVDYEAGAEKGFVAKGSHLPESPDATVTSSGSVPSPTSYYSPKPITHTSPSGSFESGPVDASYSFSYDAGDHSRQESADAAGNVKGQFAFVAKDGINRKVNYEAGSSTGFLAEGSHIPSDSSFGQKSSFGSTSSFSSSINPSYIPTKALSPTFPSSPASSKAPADASYSFSYEASDHGRKESSDPSGNVKGSYQYVAKDGINRNVEYEAGAEKGFVAKGDHLPSSSLTGGSGDLAYQYSYETDSSKKTESSDASGIVVGSYSYLGADGITRKVDYRAGGKEGFVPTGDHLQLAIGKQSSFGVPSSTFSSIPSPAAVTAGTFSSSLTKNFFPTSLTSSSYNTQNTKAKSIESTPFSLRTFLPPVSPSKFGYIYDTLA